MLGRIATRNLVGTTQISGHRNRRSDGGKNGGRRYVETVALGAPTAISRGSVLGATVRAVYLV